MMLISTKVYQSVICFLVFSALIFSSCSEQKANKEQEQIQIFNNDAATARVLDLGDTLTDYEIEKSNTGFGQVLEFKSDTANEFSFLQERNSDWYKFTMPFDTTFGFTIEPNDSTDDYDFLFFKYSDTGFVKQIIAGTVKPERSNMGLNDAITKSKTGLLCDPYLNDYETPGSQQVFSKALWVKKDEVYYLVVDNPKVDAKGYKIDFFACDGMGKGKLANDTLPVLALGKTGAEPVNTTPEVGTKIPESKTVKTTVLEKGKSDKRPKFKSRKLKLRPGEEIYVVKEGKNVYRIALEYGMTVDEVMKLNNLKSTNIIAGQKLRVINRGLSQRQIEENVAKAPKVKPTPLPEPIKEDYRTDKPEKKEVEKPRETAQIEQKPAEKETQESPAKQGQVVENMETSKIKGLMPTPQFPKSPDPASPGSTQEANALPVADKYFYLYCNVVNPITKEPMQGNVTVVDLERTGGGPVTPQMLNKAKNIINVPANKVTAVPLYKGSTRQKTLIAEFFPFRKQDFDLNLDNIVNDSTQSQVTVVDDTIIVNFNLQRPRKNDIVVAYNIFFYDDASVMLPKSKYELNSLMDLMKENKEIKIKIHGHTNGKGFFKMISLEKGDANFFAPSVKNKYYMGNATLLSKKRAESIKYYLNYNKLGDDRMETEGHGGKEALYDVNGPLAYKNKRVEVEILEDGADKK